MQDTKTADGTKKTLGRGLSSLFSENKIKRFEPESQTSNSTSKEKSAIKHEVSDDTIVNLELNNLIASKYQPRTEFDDEKLRELRDSIRKNGIIQPIVARKIGGDKLEIVAGERRWRAAKLAGLTKVPVIVKKMTDKQALEAALIENVQRQDLGPLEEAASYLRLTKEFNYTQESIAISIGKSRSHVTNIMRLSSLPHLVKQMLKEEKISTGHARALLKSDYAAQHADTVVKKGLNVRQTEALVAGSKDIKSVGAIKKRAVAKDADIIAIEKSLGTKFDSKVVIDMKKKNSGCITIDYKNLGHLDAIINMITD